MCTFTKPNYTDDKPKSFNVLRIYMIAILNKAKLDTEIIRDLNLAVIRRMNIEIIKLVLQPEVPLIGHNLLYHV
jgi:hypothetical protein